MVAVWVPYALVSLGALCVVGGALLALVIYAGARVLSQMDQYGDGHDDAD